MHEARAGGGRRETRTGLRATRQPRSAEGSLIGATLDDKYRILEEIGQGGMGTVYEAEQRSIGRRVAVKVLRPENAQKRDAVERMRHEARVVGQIGHPNICQVYDIGQLGDGTPYLVMERLRGETLAKRLETRGPVPAGELVEIALQVLGALEAAHRKGVIHRDLKPDNIFLADRASGPVAKILDFGISKATTLEEQPHHLTRTGMVMGTPYYMAPEQALGERDLDGRLDVWGMGVVLYEALSGRRPFVAKNYNALLVQILTAEAEPLERVALGLPRGLASVVHRALSKKREERHASAKELADALMPFADPRRPSSRGRPPAAGVLAVGQGASDSPVQVTRSGTVRPNVSQSPEGAPRSAGGLPPRPSGSPSDHPARPQAARAGSTGVRGTLPMQPTKEPQGAPGGRRASQAPPQSSAALTGVGSGQPDGAAPRPGGRRPATTRRLDPPALAARPAHGGKRPGEQSTPPAFLETLDHWDEGASSTSDEEEPTQVLMRPKGGAIPVIHSYDDDNEHTVVDDPPSFTEVESETETGRRRT